MTRNRIKVSYYSDDWLRVIGPTRNQTRFYKAFPDVKAGDLMFLPSDKRIIAKDISQEFIVAHSNLSLESTLFIVNSITFLE